MLNRISLASIPIDDLVLWHEKVVWRNGKDHCRWVLASRRSDGVRHVFKIWNPGYVRRDNILWALERGLYDRSVTPALWGIIVHDGICRGYVMELWGKNRQVSDDFVRSLWARTSESGYFAAQYRLSHTRRSRSSVTLIDLEGVFPVSSFRDGTHRCVEDQGYRMLIEALAAGPLSPGDVRRMADEHIATCRAPLALASLGWWMRRKGQGLHRRIERHVGALGADSRRLIQK
jgi:hypothetical protein